MKSKNILLNDRKDKDVAWNVFHESRKVRRLHIRIFMIGYNAYDDQ